MRLDVDEVLRYKDHPHELAGGATSSCKLQMNLLQGARLNHGIVLRTMHVDNDLVVVRLK